MSLVRLLTSGRSLVGLKDSVSRYRMREKNPLPKFGSSRNPFIARPGATSPAPTNVAVEAQPVRVELTPAEVAAAQLKETRRLPVLAAKGATEKATPAGLAPGVPRRISQWVRKLNPFRWRSHHRPAGTAVPPARHRSPVQGELSLDKIKVVRNDLTDADLEIVSAGEASKRNPAPVAGAKPGVALASLRPR